MQMTVSSRAMELAIWAFSGERLTKNQIALYLTIIPAIAESNAIVANGTTLFRSTTTDFIRSMGSW
jgi:hypothetical protein